MVAIMVCDKLSASGSSYAIVMNRRAARSAGVGAAATVFCQNQADVAGQLQARHFTMDQVERTMPAVPC